MEPGLLAELAAIPALAVFAQWISERLRLPAVLLVLLAGVAAGPIAGLIHPEELFGETMPGLVSLAVAIILFEGSLSLKLQELRDVGNVVPRLVTIGTAITWLVATAAGHFVLSLEWEVAFVLGALLTVSGPTVIVPLLRQIRPRRPLGSVLRWEGIVIDPVGAILSVLAFEALVARQTGDSFLAVGQGLVLTVLAGGLAGVVAAWSIREMLARFLAPHHLEVPIAITIVLLAKAGADAVQPEAGLVAATLAGVLLANQRRASVQHLAVFGEQVGVLLTSSLFLLLAARIEREDLQQLNWAIVGFVAVLVFVARPLAVAASTWRTELGWRERVYLSAMAPRGIVAASVASVFALFLQSQFDEAPLLVPYAFATIALTVALYGFLAMPLARRLNLADTDPQGLVLVGSHRWARQLASIVSSQGFEVVVVPVDRGELRGARRDDLSLYRDHLLGEDLHDALPPPGVGRMLAISHNDALNSLACTRFSELLGRENVFQLHDDLREDVAEEITGEARGRQAFPGPVCFDSFSKALTGTGELRVLEASSRPETDEEGSTLPDGWWPLFVFDDNRLEIVTPNDDSTIPRGRRTVVLVSDRNAPTPPGFSEPVSPEVPADEL